MSTKNKILIIIGIIIFICVDTPLRITLAISVAAYFLLRNQLLKIYSKDTTEKIKWLLIIPIIQACLSVFSYFMGDACINIASKINRLHDISTYTPYLGWLGKLIDFANQNGAFPEIKRSILVVNFIDLANITDQVAEIGSIITIILILLELYGTYNLGKLTIKQMKVCHIVIALIFLIISIFFGRFIDIYAELLSKIFSRPDRIPSIIEIPTITFIILCIAYSFYSQSLKVLFTTYEYKDKEAETAIETETKESETTTSESTDYAPSILQTEDQNNNKNHHQSIKHSIIPYVFLCIGCIIFTTIMIMSFKMSDNNNEDTESIAENNTQDTINRPSIIAEEEKKDDDGEFIDEDSVIYDENEEPFDSMDTYYYYKYKIYENDIYNYRINYPSFFTDIKESESGDYCKFSKDSKTFLLVDCYDNVNDETIEDKYNEYAPQKLTYSQLKNNWFVVSDYTDDGCIYYLKTVLKNNTFFSAYLQYPINEKDFYSTIINKIFKTFPN